MTGTWNSAYDLDVQTAAWIILILGFLLAGLGTLLPGLPGAAFIVLGVLLYKILMPVAFSWWIVLIVLALAIVSWVIDLLSGVLGAQWGGATKFGLFGAAVGGFVGIFFGLPGLLLGPFVGAIVGDLYGRRTNLILLFKSGAGAAAGFVFSLIARVGLLLAMGLIVTLALIF